MRARESYHSALLPQVHTLNLTQSGAKPEWWQRQRVSEYLPPVDRHALEQLAEAQGWSADGPSPPLECAHFASNSVNPLPYALCAAVRALRERGENLRHFVGFTVDVPCVGVLCDSRTTSLFFDGPLLLIGSFVAAALAVPRCARYALSGVAARLGSRKKASMARDKDQNRQPSLKQKIT
jgi:hypothetical protein